MRYLDDFNDEYGFDGGECVPRDAHATRTVYVYAFNRVSEMMGGDLRLVPLDRSGMHNWLIVSFKPKDLVRELIAADPARFAMGPGVGGWRQPDSHWGESLMLDDYPLDTLAHDMVTGNYFWHGRSGASGVFPADNWVNARNQIAWKAFDRALLRAAPAIREAACTYVDGLYAFAEPRFREDARCRRRLKK